MNLYLNYNSLKKYKNNHKNFYHQIQDKIYNLMYYIDMFLYILYFDSYNMKKHILKVYYDNN